MLGKDSLSEWKGPKSSSATILWRQWRAPRRLDDLVWPSANCRPENILCWTEMVLQTLSEPSPDWTEPLFGLRDHCWPEKISFCLKWSDILLGVPCCLRRLTVDLKIYSVGLRGSSVVLRGLVVDQRGPYVALRVSLFSASIPLSSERAHRRPEKMIWRPERALCRAEVLCGLEGPTSPWNSYVWNHIPA